jgi:uncharacterized protein YjbI with pentapeptide repeats
VDCQVSYENTNNELKCQFKGLCDANFEWDGKYWCPLHLPVKNSDGTSYSEKKNLFWEGITSFRSVIEQTIKQADYENIDINFSSVIFPEAFSIDFIYKNSVDRNNASINFQYCHFFNSIHFNIEKRFSCINFNHVNFHSNVTIFIPTNHSATISYEHTRFHGITIFKNSAFQACSFFNSEFFKEVIFLNSIFLKSTSNDFFNFDKAKFHGCVDFTNSIFAGRMSFFKAHFKEKANFSSAEDEIKKGFDFSNRTFLAKTNFSGCVFNKAPLFHGCKFHQHTIFPEKKNFKDTSSEESPHAYRALYLAMLDIKSRNEEAKFFSLMQKSERHNKILPRTERIVSWGYDKLANYGHSIFRPFMWLIGTIVAYSVLYAWLITPAISIHNKIDSSIIGNSIDCAFKQIVKPFSFYQDNASSFSHKLMALHPVLFKITAFSETVFASIFLGLLFLSIRWKFKRD